ncbi:MAG TPA: DUF1622 domain-containing protein [Sphingomonas sp.]|jgi:uncharacterized membrane protein
MDAVEWIVRAVEWTGIGIIVAGAFGSLGVFAADAIRHGFGERVYERFRSTLGRSILLGLEFLVAADIVGTVAIEPTLQGLAVLAGIVLIRTFLSFSLEVEIEGRWPWKQGRSAGSEG